MNVSLFFYDLIFRLLDKIFKKIGLSFIFKTTVGVKYINPLIGELPHAVIDCFEIEPEYLFLGVDFLSDEFSLLGTNVCKSPHFFLMRTILLKGEIRKTEYCRRLEQGSLDARKKMYISSKREKIFIDMFKKREKQIELNEYPPVKVYEVDKKLYVVDGKHRAALCALMGRKVKCEKISSDYLKDSFLSWLHSRIATNESFSKHNVFFRCLRKDSV